VFFVPVEARWAYLQAQAKQTDIGKTVDLAMEAIEKENAKRLKGILPKVYGQQKLDQKSLGGLIVATCNSNRSGLQSSRF
jgi:type I restriction enzyme M protein